MAIVGSDANDGRRAPWRSSAVASVLLLAVSACGGGSSWVIADVATITEEQRTARFSGVAESYLDDENTDLHFISDLDGLIDFDKRTALLTVASREADARPFSWHFSPAGIFMGGAGVEGAEGTRWCHVEPDGANPDPISWFNPFDVLATWSDIADDIEELGTERLGEVETLRYRAQFGRETTIDLWVDDEGRLRRTKETSYGEIETLEFHDFGREVKIPVLPLTPPENAETSEDPFVFDFCFDNGPEIPPIGP